MTKQVKLVDVEAIRTGLEQALEQAKRAQRCGMGGDNGEDAIERTLDALERIQGHLDGDQSVTLCPGCGKPNLLADAEGYTEEYPREWHADCARGAMDLDSIKDLAEPPGWTTDEILAREG